ncbi:MAG: hypothetical protein AAF962_21450 [Actinomycetota bacterium]
MTDDHQPGVRLRLTDGAFAPASWVYLWRRPSGEVLYIGATGLPPAVRTWLHLSDVDPAIGRVAAEVPEALTGEIEVCGFAVPTGIDRQAVRRGVQALVEGAPRPADIDEDAWATAGDIVTGLSSP